MKNLTSEIFGGALLKKGEELNQKAGDALNRGSRENAETYLSELGETLEQVTDLFEQEGFPRLSDEENRQYRQANNRINQGIGTPEDIEIVKRLGNKAVGKK